jgi:hypothetical protein
MHHLNTLIIFPVKTTKLTEKRSSQMAAVLLGPAKIVGNYTTAAKDGQVQRSLKVASN